MDKKLERIKAIEESIKKGLKELEVLKEEVKGEELPSMDDIDEGYNVPLNYTLQRLGEAFKTYYKVVSYLNKNSTIDDCGFVIDYNTTRDNYDFATANGDNAGLLVLNNRIVIKKCHEIAEHLEKELGYNFLDVLYKS